MNETAFMWVVVGLLILSNINTFGAMCILGAIHRNTEWGRFVAFSPMFQEQDKKE